MGLQWPMSREGRGRTTREHSVHFSDEVEGEQRMMEYSGLGEGEEMFSGDRNIRGRAARIADSGRLETFVKNVREDFPGMMKKGSMEKSGYPGCLGAF